MLDEAIDTIINNLSTCCSRQTVQHVVKGRTVYQTCVHRKAAFQSLKRQLVEYYDVTEYVGGTGPYSQIWYARQHIGSNKVFHVDITRFFHSIKTERLRRMYEKLDIDEDTARIIASEHTVNGRLMEGLPTSTINALLSTVEFSRELHSVAVSKGLSYTQWVDDIVISGDSFDEGELINEVASVASNHSLRIKNRKTSVTSKTHKIYGLVVSQSGVSATRKQKRSTIKRKDHSKDGMVAYLTQVNRGV